MLKKIGSILSLELFFITPIIYYRSLEIPWNAKIYFLFYGLLLLLLISLVVKPDIKIEPIVVIYILYIIFSWFFGEARYRGVIYFFIFVTPMITAIVAQGYVEERKVLSVILIVVAILVMEGFAQFFRSPLFLSWTKSFPHRVFSFIGNPNAFGSLLGFVSILILISFKHWSKYAFFIILFCLLLLTRSRGALISTVLAFIIYLFKVNRNIALFLFVIVLLLIFYNRERLWTSSSKQRYYLYITAAEMTRDRPVAGYGFFSFRDRLQYYILPQFRKLFSQTEVGAKFPHNEYLNQLATGGILGLTLFVVPLFFYLRENKYYIPLLVIILHNLFSFPLYYPTVALLFWFFLFYKKDRSAKPVIEIGFKAVVALFIVLGLYFVPRYQLISYYYKKYLSTRNHRYLINATRLKGVYKKEVFYKLGSIYLNGGRYKKAVGYFRKNAHYFLPTPATLINIGTTYEKAGAYNQALYYYRQTLDIRRDYDILGRIAQIYGFLGLPSQAQNYFKLSFYEKEDDVETLLKYGYFLINTEDYNRAIYYLKRALNLEYGASLNMILKDLTYCYLKTGQIDVGLDLLRKYEAHRLPDIFYYMAALYEAKGDFKMRDIYLTKYNRAMNNKKR